ncbi:CPBP family intramembrane glutamic endopeptidase [Tsukamurella sp. 1534]|uniref:CPBP family intramembrane glutamic endopeptidase n=1 Tax=Tsukamurella sp. 1534 TaxID=1151061 RepID=UPI0006ACF661|nr:CPBP family intramembrane glutamic endopeptidase [Tsukamurella sp. 1534]
MRGGAPLAAGAAVAWSNAVLPRLSRRLGWGRDARNAVNAAFCLADAALARARFPTAAGTVAGGALAVAGLVRTVPAEREPASSLAKWVLVDIPLGTALPEEALFRGSLTPSLEAAYGRPRGTVAGAATFGLWHVGAARAAQDPVVPTILVTGFAGAALDALTRRTSRSWPAFLAHWTLNGAGAILSSGSVFSSHRPINP